MVDFLDQFKPSRSVVGKNFPNFRDVGREGCFCFRQDHPKFPQEGFEEQKALKEDLFPTKNRLHDLRLLSSDWRSRYSVGLCCFILCHSA